MIRRISHHGGKKGCHDNDPKMMQRHHIGAGNSLRVRCKRKDGVSEPNEMKGGAIPLPGSHESVTRQPRNMTNRRNSMEHTRETFHTTQQAFHESSTGLSRYTFEACVSGRFEIVEGRSGSRGSSCTRP